MDRNAPDILQFDRFVLDFGRGCLRENGHDVDLRPKTFEVLRCLAENAERLVSKQELYAAVWPNAAVTDDSLVQCIRELRVKLGDGSRRLIKTVPRRGYLLDARAMPLVPLAPTGAAASESALLEPKTAVPEPEPATGNLDTPRRILQKSRIRKWALWSAVAAGILIAALGALHAASLFFRMQREQTDVAGVVRTILAEALASELFTAADANRIAEIADRKQLPLPDFRIGKPAGTVSDRARRFVGVWVSDTGWSVSHRQLMLIVTDVDGDGGAAGYVVHGPAQPKSHIQSSPNFSSFQARIVGDLLVYSDPTGDNAVSFTARNQLMLRTVFRDGTPASVMLVAVWTLADAERTARSAGGL